MLFRSSVQVVDLQITQTVKGPLAPAGGDTMTKDVPKEGKIYE